jgi:hypothetical protein
MATARQIADMTDEELLASARSVISPLPSVEPRAGFAAMVALTARDRRGSAFSAWLRWALGGLAVAGAAAIASPGPRHRADELMLAQRLELYEDMSVMQNQEALEDLDVVEVLHKLQPEGQP